VVYEIELPKTWKNFRMPAALHRRLQELLDRQDAEGRLPLRERREAEALVDLAEMLSLLKLQARRKAEPA
jgi:hypothetical protein